MNPLRKAILLGFACSMMMIGGCPEGGKAQQQRPSPSFLQSTSAHIRLGVWDKFELDNTDREAFVVTGPDGKQYKADRAESLDNWVYVNFPDDFAPYPINTADYALYSWTCTVGGKVVASGKFRWGNGQADDNNRNLDKE